ERDVRARFEPDVFGPRDATEDDVDDGLRNAASRKLAWIFLSHTKEEEEELASSRGWTGQ
ncbi:hypothetical protein HY251_11730, partial [bacterium]|nr:hypothetical protein [bacterium]